MAVGPKRVFWNPSKSNQGLKPAVFLGALILTHTPYIGGRIHSRVWRDDQLKIFLGVALNILGVLWASEASLPFA